MDTYYIYFYYRVKTVSLKCQRPQGSAGGSRSSGHAPSNLRWDRQGLFGNSCNPLTRPSPSRERGMRMAPSGAFML